MIGKWHLKSDPTGFDFWQVLQGQGPYYNPPMNTPDGVKRITGYTTDVITDVTLDWLENGRDKDKPFFVMSQHKAPHRNWQPGPKHLNKYDGIDLPEPETLRDDYKNRLSPASNQAMTITRHLSANDLKLRAPGNLTPEQKAKWNAAYDPKNKAFEEAKLEGDELLKWKYQRYVKDYRRLHRLGRREHRQVTRLPGQERVGGKYGRDLFLRPRLVPRGARLVRQAMDVRGIFPHAFDCALAGGNQARQQKPRPRAKPRLCRDLSRSLRGQAPQGYARRINRSFAEGQEAQRLEKVSLLSLLRISRRPQCPQPLWRAYEKHKLIHFYNLDGWELADLEKDPNELNSVYGKPEYAALTKELKDELERFYLNSIRYRKTPVQ